MAPFIELSVMLGIALGVSLVARLLRQPLIVGYIATGILVGPAVLNLIHAENTLQLFSNIGISVLLFMVGLTLNPDIVREVGRTSVLIGIGQVLFTSLIGFVIVHALGFGVGASLYAGIALTFSSTIIVLKLLSDRDDMEKLYAKVAIGLLLVQDAVAMLVLLIATSVGATSFAEGITLKSVSMELAQLLMLGGFLVACLSLVSTYVLPRVVSFVGGNQEILFLFSIAWGLGLSALFAGIGFSAPIGALIAGMALAVSPFAYEIGARMKPLRDFFILGFFILLGAQMALGNFSHVLVPALALSAFVLVGNPLIVFFLMNLAGYRNRTAFMTGLTVAQVSEFSLILVSLGHSLGHISQDTVSLVTLVGMITIACSTYMVLYADTLYVHLSGLLARLAIRRQSRRAEAHAAVHPDIIIFGYDRVGHEFVSVAAGAGKPYVVVDYNPQSIMRLHQEQIPHRYGDAEDVEFLQDIGFIFARLIISTIPDHKTNLLLARYYRTHNPTGIVMVLAHRTEDAEELYAAGASYVIMPHHLGAHHAARMIARHGLEPAGFAEERRAHLMRIRNLRPHRTSAHKRNPQSAW